MISVRGCHCDYGPRRKQNLVTPLRIQMHATTNQKIDMLSYVVIFVEGKFWWRC